MTSTEGTSIAADWRRANAGTRVASNEWGLGVVDIRTACRLSSAHDSLCTRITSNRRRPTCRLRRPAPVAGHTRHRKRQRSALLSRGLQAAIVEGGQPKTLALGNVGRKDGSLRDRRKKPGGWRCCQTVRTRLRMDSEPAANAAPRWLGRFRGTLRCVAGHCFARIVTLSIW